MITFIACLIAILSAIISIVWTSNEKKKLAQEKERSRQKIQTEKEEMERTLHFQETLLTQDLKNQREQLNLENSLLTKRQQDVNTFIESQLNQIKTLEETIKQKQKDKNLLQRQIEGYDEELYSYPVSQLHEELINNSSYSQASIALKQCLDEQKESFKTLTKIKKDLKNPINVRSFITLALQAYKAAADNIIASSANPGIKEQKIKDLTLKFNKDYLADIPQIPDQYEHLKLKEIRLKDALEYDKQLTKEEQMRERERIKEENIARREIEKALREADAKQTALAREIESAKKKELEAKSDAEREKMRLRIQELETNLQDVIESTQRAQSMAQQTRCGFVYVISNIGSFGENVFKVGMSRRLDPLDRVRELGDASVPFAFDVHAMIFSENAPALENALHKELALYQVNKTNYRKEFFKCALQQIKDIVTTVAGSYEWNENISATEYRETRAIENLIAKDPQAKESWLARQLKIEDQSFEIEDEA